MLTRKSRREMQRRKRRLIARMRYAAILLAIGSCLPLLAMLSFEALRP